MPIYSRQIKQFRSAIIQHIVAIENIFIKNNINIDYFINRNIESESFDNVYRYPLIQYQISGKNAAITGINQGAAALRIFAENLPHSIIFDNKKSSIKINNISDIKFKIESNDVPIKFKMFKWVALNDDNFRKYQSSDDLITRAELLNTCLYGHIKNFLSAVGISQIEFKAYLSSIGMESWATIKDIKKKVFDVTFACNFNLPDNICIGQHAAIGFGKIRLLKKINQF